MIEPLIPNTIYIMSNPKVNYYVNILLWNFVIIIV